MSQNVQKLVQALTSGFQNVEDAFWALLVERSIDEAVGAQLEQLGRIVGQPNVGGVTDDKYRVRIRARIAANKSRGSIEDILVIAKLILDGLGAKIEIDQQGMAAFVARLHAAVIEEDTIATLVEYLKQGAAAGVNVVVEYLTASVALSLRLPATFLTAAITGAATSIPVHDVTRFPPAGAAIVDPNLGTAEAGNDQHDVFSYTGISGLNLTGVTGLNGSHLQGAAVVPSTWQGLGLGDDGDAAVGGDLAGAKA